LGEFCCEKCEKIAFLNFSCLCRSGGDSEFDNLNDNDVTLDDGEPPFRKAGQFDPYSDDPRLAVKKLAFCPKTGILTVAGTAGNVVLASLDIPLEKEDQEIPLKVTTMNLVSDRDGFVWKGHDQLKVKHSLLNTENLAAEGVQVGCEV
jgi:lethal(2) giant larvae protein